MRCTPRLPSVNVARTIILLSLLTTAAMPQISQPRRDVIPGQLQKRANAVYKGCYSSAASMSSVGTYMYQSTGYCSTQCANQDSPAMALTSGNDCYCGDELPADSDKVDDSKCNSPCTGYGQTNCAYQPTLCSLEQMLTWCRWRRWRFRRISHQWRLGRAGRRWQ